MEPLAMDALRGQVAAMRSMLERTLVLLRHHAAVCPRALAFGKCCDECSRPGSCQLKALVLDVPKALASDAGRAEAHVIRAAKDAAKMYTETPDPSVPSTRVFWERRLRALSEAVERMEA